MYALAFPPAGYRWLALAGPAGLLLALDGLEGFRARAIGFLHGLAVYAVGLFWLHRIFGWLAISLWAVLALFTALFAAMQARALRRGLDGWRLAVFTAVNWCGWEFVRAELFPLKFPWMTAGLAVGPNVLLPWIGVYGVSFVVVLCAGFAIRRLWIPSIVIPAALIAAVVAMRPVQAPDAADPRRIAVGGLQFEDASLNQFIDQTRELPDDIRHVVWPEYAVPFNPFSMKWAREMVEGLCRERNITLTLGTKLPVSNGSGWRNVALTLDPAGIRGEHTKVNTVHFFDDGQPGTSALPVLTLHGQIGTPVCFDCDFESVTRRMTSAGAEAFLVPSMDAAHWSAVQHDQHAELFRIRACENGRWMFVCATSGVSQIIDPHGHVHLRLAALASGPITGALRRESSLTFYTRLGWAFPWLVLAAAVVAWTALLLAGVVIRRKLPSAGTDNLRSR